MGNKPTYFSFQARMKCGWGSKGGGNAYIYRWFMGMGCANKESEIQNDIDSREDKMDLGTSDYAAYKKTIRSKGQSTFILSGGKWASL